MWVSIIVISLIGTLSHFLYDISGHNKIVGLFTAVNESTWEHMKIAITPTLLWGLYDGYVYGIESNYFVAKLCSLLAMCIIIPLVFYSQKIFFKKDSAIINILSFYVAIIIGQFLFYHIIEMPELDFIFSYISCIGLFIFFGAYLLLTLLPLELFIFKDPISKKYGFKGHTEDFSIIHKKK